MWRKSALRSLVPWLDLSVDSAHQVAGALAADGARLSLAPGGAAIEAAHDDSDDGEPLERDHDDDVPALEGPEPDVEIDT